MADNFFCLHAHFCQLPRSDPLTGEEAVPEWVGDFYSPWKERVAEQCYAPNVELGNFALMSYDLSSSMGRWMQENQGALYQRILNSDRDNVERWGAGNALAQPLHHTVLPLSWRRDKKLQVSWGLEVFAHRYGRPAVGMWLPEMAVDLETLEILHDSGVQFTILSQSQVRGAPAGAGPYWVKLSAGKRLAVYVRDETLSNQLAFDLQHLGGAGRWARDVLAPLRWRDGRLVLLALDGETFGYHYPGEEHFLHWLLAYEAGAVGYQVTTLARDLRDHPPTREVEINEFTAWNCFHGLGRWSIGCECTTGNSRWKCVLRRALDNLSERVDEIYADYVRQAGIDGEFLLEHYMQTRLGEITDDQLLREAGGAALTSAQADILRALLLAQYHRQRMYVSYAFYFEDLERLEPLYAIANAVRTVVLVMEATGVDLGPHLKDDLAQAVAASGKTGAQIYDAVENWARAYVTI